MKLLTDKLPESIEIDGTDYNINSDFKTWIKFESLINDFKEEPEKAIIEILTLCFKKSKNSSFKLPSSFQKVIKGLFDFYIGNTTNSSYNEEEVSKNSKSQRIYSFEYDAEYIYAAFMQQYGIDLCQSDMHWWQFKALFSSLTDDTKIGEIMGIRAMNIDCISDNKQKSHYRKLKRIYALPDSRSEDEKECDFADIIDGTF